MGMHPVPSRSCCNNGWTPHVGRVGFPVLLEHMVEHCGLFWITKYKLDWINVSIAGFRNFLQEICIKYCIYEGNASVYLQLNGSLVVKLAQKDFWCLVFIFFSFFFVIKNEIGRGQQIFSLTCVSCICSELFTECCASCGTGNSGMINFSKPCTGN